MAQHPEVRIGTVPEGAPEVYIAPQKSEKRKDKAKGKDKAKDAEEEKSPQALLLHLIPDAAYKALDELIAEHGDALRIAIEAEKLRVAITGSHIRVSGLHYVACCSTDTVLILSPQSSHLRCIPACSLLLVAERMA